MRRWIRHAALLLCMLGVGTAVSLASGADAETEKDVKKMQSDAMDVDFLSLDFKSAKTRLQNAVKKCGADKCGNSLLAGLHRDLGVVLINMKDKKGGAKEFEEAVKLDSKLSMPKDYLQNADVKAEWGKASGGAGATTATTTAPTTTGTGKPPVSAEAEGNLTVTVKMAPIGWKLPIVIEVPDGEDITKVSLSYKTVSMEKYKTLDAKKDSGKYVVTIECTDTQFVGEIKYYARAYDEEKNEVDHYGTLKKPGVIKLVDKMPDDVEAPTYPGGKEPDKCKEGGDCPPGFPCDKNKDGKPEGSGCSEDQECQPGLSCVLNDNGTKWCHDTGGGGPKPGGPSGAPKLWIGLDAQVDLLYIGGGEDICKEQTWACTVNGTDVGVSDSKGIDTVKADPVAGTPSGSGKTSGGPALGTIRVMATLDYFIMSNLSIGGRLGYAFNGNPTENAKFLPFHAEGRLMYWLGNLDAKGQGFRPYLLFSGGLAEYDAAVKNVNVVAATNTKNTDLCGDGTVQCIKGVSAYRLAGQGFVAIGAGGWFHLSRTMALNMGLKFLFPLPTFSLGIAPEVGLRIGF